MCGLAGFWSVRNDMDLVQANEILIRMADAVVHRGPDSSGYWFDSNSCVGLAHRRLAIVDLSNAGSQPMESMSRRYVIAFNGEIYNHLKLRSELGQKGYVKNAWRGHSDTETLLAGFEAWGVEATLQRAIGMFSFALWDCRNYILTLGRDRIGEKPIYYGWQGQGNQSVFLFGSELSVLRKHPGFQSEVNRDALALYMRHNCIGADYSIYAGIHKLLPGHLLTISTSSREPVVKAWWSAADIVVGSLARPFVGSPEQAVNELETLLRDAVAQQMLADVPLGAFLSGGIDSSTVVALMQAQSSKPVCTFSIGFREKGYNEAEHAKAVANYLGTKHTELYVTPQEALAVIPLLPTLYSEPFADSSQIPTFLLSQLARQHVTVSLSGDAGDELFCGYNRYQYTAKLWHKIALMPRPLRLLVARLIMMIAPRMLDKFGELISVSRLGDKMHKSAGLLGSRTIDDWYISLVSHWRDPESVVLGAEPTTTLKGFATELHRLSDLERMMALDMMHYLPDDILVKVDRAAMGVSLETRVPFLDHRVVEFAWTLPLNYKLRKGVTKWPLRQVLYRYVPRELIERPKMGFGIPIDQWLRGSLRDWAESLLSESRLRHEGYFNPEPIRRKWSEHLSGKRNWQHHLWNVLMFQAWLENCHG